MSVLPDEEKAVLDLICQWLYTICWSGHM